MTGEIVLEAALPLDCHVIIARISVYTNLTYAMPVLMHAREAGTATAESLSAALFPKLGPLCQRLLERCCEDGTLERNGGGYGLTEEGRFALEDGSVPEKRSGAWKLYILPDHPIVPEDARVLRIEGGADEAQYNRDHPDPEPLTDAVRALPARIVAARFGEHGRFRIDEVDGYQKVLRHDTRARLRLVVGGDGTRIFLGVPSWKGGYEQAGELNLAYDDAVEEILSANGFDWDREGRRVPLWYEDTELEERLSMRKTLELKASLLGCEFEPLKMRFKICPKTQDGADRWAEDLFSDGIRGYMTARGLRELEAEIRERLPESRIGSTERHRYVSRLEPGTPKFWFLRAPEDWGL